jgi:hypothetical protein
LGTADRHDERPTIDIAVIDSYASPKGGHTMEQLDRLPYEAPMVLDSFDAFEVMGSAEGQSVGCGSTVCV